MKLDKLVGDRFKERPADCVIDSHALMVRGGYIKNVANGIFSSYPVMKRITRKIEEIIRQEMDAIDGQEVLFPVVMPASLWEESGRYESVGSELLRFKDRTGSNMVLGMTHEEAAVHLVREYGQSYTKYPFMIYQIQTKFRDEARPRAGMIRVREFTMKDAYSYHTSQEDLEAYYDRAHKAYERIFARAGIPEVISIESDSGMMGGSVSHEFMLITEVGEDTIVHCTNCDYKANIEAAEVVVDNTSVCNSETSEATAHLEVASCSCNGTDTSACSEQNTCCMEEVQAQEELHKVATPNVHTIEDVCNFLGTSTTQACKAVVYQKNSNDDYVVVFIRGDLDTNETKIRNFLGEDIHPAEITEDSAIVAGFIGPMGLDTIPNITLLFDRSLEGLSNLITGANEVDFHYTGFDIARDYKDVTYVDVAKAMDGGICPSCKQPTLSVVNGIEVGNIFQLCTKYTTSMGMQYTDENGELQYPVMGCYGIGVGRLAASVCESHHDEYGPIWPMSIAPWQVHLCCLRADDAETRVVADQVYQELLSQGIEVIYDDRQVRPGVMFSDADLLGVPVRAIVSPRNLKEGLVEIKTRDKEVNISVSVDEAVTVLKQMVVERLI